MTTTAQVIAKLQARLALYETALKNALTAQSYSINGRSKQMAQVRDLQNEIDRLEARIARLQQTNSSAVYAPKFIPRTSLDSDSEDCDE